MSFQDKGERLDDWLYYKRRLFTRWWRKIRGIPEPVSKYTVSSAMTAEALRILSSNLQFGDVLNRDYESEFGDGQGVINIRKPPTYTVRAGRLFNVDDIEKDERVSDDA